MYTIKKVLLSLSLLGTVLVSVHQPMLHVKSTWVTLTGTAPMFTQQYLSSFLKKDMAVK